MARLNRSTHVLAVVLAALLALASAQQLTGNGFSTSTSSDAGANVTSGPMVYTAANTCNSTCRTAYKAIRLAAYNGSCDLCTSNSGNSSLASWSTFSGNCSQCATTWNTYQASCAGGANKACFNFNAIANGNTKSIANLLTQSAGVALGGDVYDFFSQYTSAISTCSDAFDYLASYALTTNNDPLFPANVTGSDCPVQGGSNMTCSAACNNDFYLLAALCQTQTVIQYDNNGLPGPNGVSVAAPPGTFITMEVALQYLVNGTAMGPYNNNTNTGTGDVPYVLTDHSCVASKWMQTFTDGTTGLGLSTSTDASTPIPTTPLGVNTTAQLPTPVPANITCLQAAAMMNTSVAANGVCDMCLSDTGSAQGCAANCPSCGSVFTAYIDACGATGDNTLQPTFALASYWAVQLQSVAGNFSYGDCYLTVVQQVMTPLAAVCSDYVASLAMSSLTMFQSAANPNNSSLTINGPDCPTTASDTAYAPGTCPAACAADLALLSGCQSTSIVNIPMLNVNNVPFPTAWAQLVNGSMGVVNSLKTANAAFNLTGCSSSLATYSPGVLANGGVNASILPTAAPNCSVARATLTASTASGACDLCSSNTGNPANCFTNVAGDPDCLQCGVQFDQYTNACNETYNDIGNTFAANLLQTAAAGNRGDCFDAFNQLAQSLIGTPNFDTDACSDTWDSIVQYSETIWNDPGTDTAGANCNVIPGNPCSTACQGDLTQLNTYCTSSSVVQWAGFGYGFAANGSAIVAPAGTTVPILTAWLLFTNGTATAPIGNTLLASGAAAAVPFTLDTCTLPTWAPTTGPGSLAGMQPATVSGNFSINLGSTTLTQLYAANANGTIEAAIAASLGVATNAVTIPWSTLIAAGRRHLLASTTIPYTVTTTASVAASGSLQAKASTFNTGVLVSVVAVLPGLSGVTVAAPPSPPPPPPSPPPPMSAAVSTKHAVAVAVALAVALGL